MTHFFETEFDFVLPKGLIDADGILHRTGRMRLATAKDELSCFQDTRVQADLDYGVLVMLSAVIVQLGELNEIAPEQLEELFRPDFHYLKSFYQKIHQSAQPSVTANELSGYTATQLQEEVAYIAYYFHWPLSEILQLDHVSRRQWIATIDRLR